jgi:hypothetical protein
MRISLVLLMLFLQVAATPLNVDDSGFVPSGWTGDGARKDPKGEAYVRLQVERDAPHSPPTCWKLDYRPGPDGWAAIAWQFPENNWGDRPGRDLRSGGFHQVSFWARALPDSSGAFPRIQVKAGGGTDPKKRNQASFSAESSFLPLGKDWKQYTLDISGKDLSRVMSAFTVAVRALDVGKQGATVFLDDIEYR